MKSAQESKKVNQNSVTVDLPGQKIWKELEQCVVESSLEGNQPMDRKKAERIEQLMDQAYELLLEKLIRQN